MFWIFLIVGLIVLAAFLQTKKKSVLERASKIAAHHWPATGDYDVEVVGESFNQATLKTLAGDHGTDSAAVVTTAHLVPYKNKHDPQAVRIDIQDKEVGHLSREDARTFRKRLSANKLYTCTTSCAAMIVGGFTKANGDATSYGVKLDMEPLD